MTALVEHARTELERLDVEPAMAATIVAAIAVVAAAEPSPVRRERMLRMIAVLGRGRTLSPLTADPAEWVDRREAAGVPLWQNRRDPAALSDDGGRSYWMDGGEQPQPRYRSVVPYGWVSMLRDRHGVTQEAAVAAIGEYLDSGSLTGSDRELLASLPAGERDSYGQCRWGEQGWLVAEMLLSALWAG